MNKLDSINDIETLKEFFLNDKNVLLAFLFGSTAAGDITIESDIDIAILFDIPPDSNQYLQFLKKINRLVTKNIDIVILNTASPIIKMQVLKNGIPLKFNRKVYSEFYLNTVKEYDDLKIIRKEQENSILKDKIYA